MGAVAALAIAILWWSFRGGNESRPATAPLRAPVPVAHEPPPPPPPPEEPQAPSAEPTTETSEQVPKTVGASVAAEPSASPTPAYGPNVARYPDLPTPVLIQLEKDQQETNKKK